VENSFKHGVSNQLDHVWVRIDILVKDQTLLVKVENSKAKQPTGATASDESGIGLQNVKKRLQLIYPDGYDLQLFDEADTYLVVLKIALSSAQMAPPAGELPPRQTVQQKMVLG
jgi:LytS/YehU family sensor histidine kinase